MTKINELRSKNRAELQGLLTEKLEALRKSRFDIISGQLTNVREIRKLRNDIARIKTLLNAPQQEQVKTEAKEA
ncbi:50S ribosomal protein L29 [Patescibacteria group bacterium]